MEKGRAASHFLSDSRNIDQKELTCCFLQNNKHNQSMELIKKFEILQDLEYFLPRNICTFLFTDQLSFYKICAVLKPFLFKRSVESQSCFPSCSPGSFLCLSGRACCASGSGCCWNPSDEDQTNKMHTLVITWWQPAVQGTSWKQFLLWENMSPGSA